MPYLKREDGFQHKGTKPTKKTPILLRIEDLLGVLCAFVLRNGLTIPPGLA